MVFFKGLFVEYLVHSWVYFYFYFNTSLRYMFIGICVRSMFGVDNDILQK